MAKDKKEDIVEEEVLVETPSKSLRRKEFEAIIEAYKKANPVKYELKKEELARKLSAIQ